jgi:hypothetical protein
LSNLIPGQAENTITRLPGTASPSSYRLTISKALVNARKCVCGLASAIRAHAAQVVGAEDVAGDMPAKQTRPVLGNSCRNLPEIGIRMTLGDAFVPPPCIAGGGIKPIGLPCVASFAGARNALRTTCPLLSAGASSCQVDRTSASACPSCYPERSFASREGRKQRGVFGKPGSFMWHRNRSHGCSFARLGRAF